MQPPTRPASKPVTYDPLSSIRAPEPKPTTTPLQPIIPLVVITAFDLDTAEELGKRLQNTVHPADRPEKQAHDPLSSKRSPKTSSEPSPPDIMPDIEEPDLAATDPEFAWSSEQPYLSMNIADLSYYISAQQDELVRSVTISLQHEKFILAYLENPVEYLKNFAEYGWDEESDEAAEAFIQWHVSRFRSELEEQRELSWSAGVESDIEYSIRDVTNDERESVIVYDLDAGETLFVRAGAKNTVTLQKIHQTLAEGHNIIVIHNHPNNTGASLADFSAAAWLDAEYMIVVNPDGRQHHHRRIGDRMVALAPVQNLDYVAPADPLETLAADLAYFLQRLREIGNPPERVMRQEELLADDIPLGLNADQVWDSIEKYAALALGEQFDTLTPRERQIVIADWKSDWFENPESWIDYNALANRLPIVEEAVQKWNHPASGMSNDEMTALLMGNLHREAHYRRQEPSVYKMNPGEFGLNLGDRGATYVGNLGKILAALVGYGDGDPSVGPANLRIQVVNEILGTNDQAPYIPMPNGGKPAFYDMGRLDHWSRLWQNLTDKTRPSEAARRRLLNNDRFAIELMAANVYRGVERLYQRYLDDQEVLEDYLQHQRFLAQGDVEQYRQERGFSHQFLEQASRQQQYLEQYLQQDKYRATMFNMSAWLSQGIAESRVLRNTLDNQAVTDAINHARETVPSISGILGNEAFGLSPSEDGFIMFNEDDFNAYLRDTQ